MRVAAIATGLALCATPAAAADESELVGLERPVYGAAGPALGGIVVRGSLGMALILPHIVASGRVGLGGGAYAELGYGNLAVFGQEGRFRAGWGTPIADGFDLGVALRSSIATLALADGTLVGIDFSSLPIGNDWEIGNDVVLSIHRPGDAHITLALGPTFTLGGTRYASFRDSEAFAFDPAIRSIEAAVQSEWSIWESANVFVRLDAEFLLGVESDDNCVEAQQESCAQLVPFGFIPTGAVGVLWSL